MKVLVITPTIGHEKLGEAVSSVAAQQTLHQIDHLLVIDGPEYVESVNQQARGYKTAILPYNVGKEGFYGHRAYAAMSHLIPSEYDYVLFLDEDNWFEPEHVEICVKTAHDSNLAFSYALRSFYTYDGDFFAEDNCSSLGKWKLWDSGGHHLVDTNAYCFRRDFIEKYGHLWHARFGADRQFYNLVSSMAKHECTGQRTVAYRLALPTAGKYEEELRFITENNRLAEQKYPHGYPWVA